MKRIYLLFESGDTADECHAEIITTDLSPSEWERVNVDEVDKENALWWKEVNRRLEIWQSEYVPKSKYDDHDRKRMLARDKIIDDVARDIGPCPRKKYWGWVCLTEYVFNEDGDLVELDEEE